VNVAITASGGGHTGYALALAENMLELGYNVSMILDPRDAWSARRILHRLKLIFPQKPVKVLYAARLRSPRERATTMLRRLPGALAHILKITKEIQNTDIIICTGSNHSLLPAFYALLLGKKVVCLEAVDRIATRSKTVALLHDAFAVPVALQWPIQKKNYRRGVVVGPVYERAIYESRDEGFILVVTGSEGNPRLVKKLARTSLENVVIQTGRAVGPKTIRVLERLKPSWKLFQFTPDIDWWMSRATLVVGHQGLSIVEAALAYGKPVLLAFNPDLPLTSGLQDAVLLARHLNTEVINPATATPEEIEEKIHKAMKRKPPKYIEGARELARNLDHILNVVDR
jgi:UDP-N-acetylglucosamine--N-acetylmuramyl-(pentapeptide) pyrophosphoryl-undecaprenol N-acetylglucosamine transferase